MGFRTPQAVAAGKITWEQIEEPWNKHAMEKLTPAGDTSIHKHNVSALFWGFQLVLGGSSLPIHACSLLVLTFALAMTPTPKQADTELRYSHMFMPKNLNHAGSIFGGDLISWMESTKTPL